MGFKSEEPEIVENGDESGEIYEYGEPQWNSKLIGPWKVSRRDLTPSVCSMLIPNPLPKPWTERKTFHLIKLFHWYPCLLLKYDVDWDSYVERREVLEEVARRLGYAAEQTEARFNFLRAEWRMRNQAGGKAHNWIYFAKLNLLFTKEN